jgi:hypothetical protein
MRFLGRRAGQLPPPGAATTADRFHARPGSNDPQYDPGRTNGEPLPSPRPRDGRADLTELLGRSVLAARTQQICRDHGLIPRSGTASGSGLSRSYLARDTGVEVAADAYGVVTTVFLHFDGDDGFASYRGELPGGGGVVPRRTHLWAQLGRPGESGEPYGDGLLGGYGPWDRWRFDGFLMHAQYAPDGDHLRRVTLTPLHA